MSIHLQACMCTGDLAGSLPHASQLQSVIIVYECRGWSNTFGHIIEGLTKSGTYPARL